MPASRPIQLTTHMLHVINKKVTSFQCQTSIDKRDAQVNKQVPENTLILFFFGAPSVMLRGPFQTLINARVNCVFGGNPQHTPSFPIRSPFTHVSTHRLDFHG